MLKDIEIIPDITFQLKQIRLNCIVLQTKSMAKYSLLINSKYRQKYDNKVFYTIETRTRNVVSCDNRFTYGFYDCFF